MLVLHIYSCYSVEEQTSKSSKHGRPEDVYRTQLRDVPGISWERSRYVDQTCFLNSFHKHIKFTLTDSRARLTQDSIVNGKSDKFSEHYSG